MTTLAANGRRLGVLSCTSLHFRKWIAARDGLPTNTMYAVSLHIMSNYRTLRQSQELLEDWDRSNAMRLMSAPTTNRPH